MKPAPSGIAPSLRQVFRLMAILALLSAPLARADEYGDVSQLVRSGNLTQAQAQADKHLSTKPRDPQMRFLKGVIQSESGKATEAIATFQALTVDYPELPEPYNNLAVLYANQHHFDKARAALEMAVRTNPNYAIAHDNLGDIYVKLAMQAYDKAYQLDSRDTSASRKLGLLQNLLNPTTEMAAPQPTPTASGTVRP